MQLKEIYDQDFFLSLNKAAIQSYRKFDEKKFLELIYINEWPKMALKARMHHICQSLNQVLSQDYQQDLEILKNIVQNINVTSKYPQLSLIIFATYIEIFGADNFDISMQALEFFTPFGSAEFAVRKFFIQNPDKTLKYFNNWSKSTNYHVRRLASEGLRPRLPWGVALKDLKKDPTPILPILDRLKNDKSEYVRKSVANNLNDISKDHVNLVLNIAKKWLNEDNKNIKLVKHGLRTLLKSSNSQALELFGYKKITNPIESFDLQKLVINIGQDLSFRFKISLNELVKLRIEYAIYFLQANNSYSKKVFQISEKTFTKGLHQINKKHSFKKITTRRYYSGQQKIALIINGQEFAAKKFSLK